MGQDQTFAKTRIETIDESRFIEAVRTIRVPNGGMYVSDSDEATLTYPVGIGYRDIFPQTYGAFGDGSSHTITSGDITAHPEWVGTYSAGDEWDYVGIQEAIYAAYGTNRTNASGLSYLNLRLRFYGHYKINKELKCYHINGFYWEGDQKFGSIIEQTATNKRIIDGQSMTYGFFSNIKFSTSASQLGIAQVETATVLGTVTGTGNATVIVTASGMTNSPKTVSVAVVNGDSASTVGGKIRTALAADVDVNGFFIVSGTGANVVLTAKINNSNDATMNVSIANGTSTGLTSAPTSTNTTAGLRGIPLIDLDYDGSQGDDLRPQNITFLDCVFEGNNVGYIGCQVSKSGGGAQGDNLRFYNCYANGFAQAAYMIGDGVNGLPYAFAYNAIYLQFVGGDIQSCPQYGIACFYGSILVQSMTFENQTLGHNGIPTQTGADIFLYAPPSICEIRNVRSESLRLIQGPANLKNIQMSPYGTAWWAAGTGASLAGTAAYVDQLVTGTVSGGDGKIYHVTVADLDLYFDYRDTEAPFTDQSVINDNTHTYTVNELAGKYLQMRYPNCYDAQVRLISSNTAHTITLASPVDYPYGDSPGEPCGPHTQYRVINAFPTWGGLPLTTATSGSSTTIVKTGAGWTINAFTGWRVSIVSGKGKLQYGVITGNTSDTITVTAWLTDYLLESLYPDFKIVNPDSTSQFVVEPDWGTQTTSGTQIEWEAFDFNVVDGSSGRFIGTIDGFGGSQGGKFRVDGGNFSNIQISRADAFSGSVVSTLNDVFVANKFENIRVNRLVNEAPTGIPWKFPRNTGQQVLGPGITQRTQGTEPIMWQAGQYGGGVDYPDVGIGRGDGAEGTLGAANVNNVLALLGETGSAGDVVRLGRRHAIGTNQAGKALRAQGGLSTGTGVPGPIEFYIGAPGSTGTAVNAGALVGGISSNRLSWHYKGPDVASAATIIPSGNVFHVTGTTNITSVDGTGVSAGTEITIIFDGVLTFTDGSNLKLNGNFVTSADDVIKLVYDGSNWFEVSRSAN